MLADKKCSYLIFYRLLIRFWCGPNRNLIYIYFSAGIPEKSNTALKSGYWNEYVIVLAAFSWPPLRRHHSNHSKIETYTPTCEGQSDSLANPIAIWEETLIYLSA